MRRYLWVIPALLLITALGSTPVRADTIITESNGVVTEIDGLVIGTNTYNVTVGLTPDYTFIDDTSGTASQAAQDIVNDLNSVTAPLGVIGAPTFDIHNSFFIPSPVPHLYPNAGYLISSASRTLNIGGMNLEITTWGETLDLGTPGDTYYAEFTPSTVSTPEPGSFTLTVIGMGLLGLLVMTGRGKRRSFSLPMSPNTAERISL